MLKLQLGLQKPNLRSEFDISKTSLDKLLKNIADVGHDNEKYKTSQDVYDNLPLVVITTEQLLLTKQKKTLHKSLQH